MLRVGLSLSEWLDIILEVPYGSILGPIRFNAINDLPLFLKETDTCNFADDTILYVPEKDLDIISNK